MRSAPLERSINCPAALSTTAELSSAVSISPPRRRSTSPRGRSPSDSTSIHPKRRRRRSQLFRGTSRLILQQYQFALAEDDARSLMQRRKKLFKKKKKKKGSKIICNGGNWFVCSASLSSCSLMLFLHSNPLKAPSQTALTSAGQAFLSPEKYLKEKNSWHFFCVSGCRPGFCFERFSPRQVENFEGF